MIPMKAVTLLLVSSAGLGLLGMSSASAGPASGAVISDAAASVGQLTENVQWRGWGWRGGGWGWRGGGWGWGGVGLGLATGAVVGSALAAPYYGYGYYAPPIVAAPPVVAYDYAPAYTYAPAYSYGYAPAYGYGYGYAARPFWGYQTYATDY
jgi:hypothetical protein